jgi:hypothetical protein
MKVEVTEDFGDRGSRHLVQPGGYATWYIYEVHETDP